MMFKKIFTVLLLTTCIFFLAEAQDTSRAQKPSYFKASVSYLTNSVYNGRKDSGTLPYITPSIGYYDKSGFYISGSLSYLASGTSRIDLFTLEAGYDFVISPTLSGGIYGSKYFYNNSSTSVRSAIKGSLGGSLSYDPGIITVSGGLDISIASKADITFNASIAHGFYFGEKGREWSITPTLSLNAGTQNSYQDYIKNKKLKRTGGANTLTTSSGTFGILDYELSIPVAYDGNKWGLFFTPTYAIPQNPVSVASSGSSTYVTEKLENSFFAEVGVYIKF